VASRCYYEVPWTTLVVVARRVLILFLALKLSDLP
jgi:hypothetical protein